MRDALIVREIRNTCREYLTNYREAIGVLQQVRWYFRYYRGAQRSSTYRLYLFLSAEGEPVGYGGLQLRENRLYVTECVKPACRGKGYGKAILEAMVAVARQEQREIIAEIWASNERSVGMHERAGFVLQSRGTQDGQELRAYSLKP